MTAHRTTTVAALLGAAPVLLTALAAGPAQAHGAPTDPYQGLYLARADWPATRLTAGADLTLTYRSTIPHTGTFELYLTKEGYDPTGPLKWSDLEAKPFATATDPALADDAYRIEAKLPSGRTGRQLLFTIWRNTSTPDTYYSCSDVVFTGADGTPLTLYAGGAAALAVGAGVAVTLRRRRPRRPR